MPSAQCWASSVLQKEASTCDSVPALCPLPLPGVALSYHQVSLLLTSGYPLWTCSLVEAPPSVCRWAPAPPSLSAGGPPWLKDHAGAPLPHQHRCLWSSQSFWLSLESRSSLPHEASGHSISLRGSLGTDRQMKAHWDLLLPWGWPLGCGAELKCLRS